MSNKKVTKADVEVIKEVEKVAPQKEEKQTKALFSQRLGAFILDIILVAIISTLLTTFIPTSKAATKLYDEQTTIMENYINRKSTINEYMNQMVDISYDIAKETAVISIVSIIISLLYFVLYPAYHNGQTVGKKLMKIKITKTNHTDLTMNDLLFRAMIINSILVSLLSLCLVLFTSKTVYLNSSSILTGLQYLVMIISALMIAFTKSKQGIHDKIVHTDVVMADLIKEEVLCEAKEN